MHDNARHGTLSLFATLDTASGNRGREFLNFLREIERSVPSDIDVHLVMARHGRDGASISRRPQALGSIRRSDSSPPSRKSIFVRGVHRSPAELEAAIRDYIEAVSPQPQVPQTDKIP
jgi:hypothetical protein